MREFSDDFKMSIRSVAELRGYLASLLAELQGRGFKFADENLTREMIVNALLAYVRGLDNSTRDRLLIAAFSRLREVLETDPEEVPSGVDLARTGAEVADFVPPAASGPVDMLDEVTVTRIKKRSLKPKGRKNQGA